MNEHLCNDVEMSTKVPTEVKCHDNGSAKKTTIDIKCQKLTPKVPLQANCQCKLAPPESHCWSVKNPWIVRIGATFAISAILVIYGALYSRLGERMEARDKTMSEVEKLINGLQERIEELEAR